MVGSVKVKMFDGIISTLTKVRHVHELIDLIFLGALEVTNLQVKVEH